MAARLSVWEPSTLLSTWFGCGLIPGMPGTWGSLAALPLGWLIVHFAGTPALAGAAGLVFALGLWTSDRYARLVGRDDPGEVVIDEVAAQWLVLLPMAGDYRLYPLAFLLFRVFDIWKPWPVSWIDRHLGGGFGIMADDVIAALYALAVYYALAFLYKLF